MAKSSLSICFVRVINALCIIAPRIIKWPQGREIDAITDKFIKISNIPNVLDAIDGSYIPIKAPTVDPESYINRKCFYAITMQGICDPSLKFIDCFAGYPSSVSDVRIFRNSGIYTEYILHIYTMSNTNRYFPGNEFLLGDKAYPVLQWLIPSYIDRGNLNAVNKRFNESLSKGRQVIERALALLKGRFRRLKYLDMHRTDLIPATILATCVIHNSCIDLKDTNIEQFMNEGMEVDDNMNENIRDPVQNCHEEISGIQKRNALAEYPRA